MFIAYDSSTPILPQWIGNLTVLSLGIPVCFLIVRKLIPRFLYRRRIKLFVGSVLVLAIANAVATYIIALFIYHLLTGHAMFRSVLYFSALTLEMLLADVFLIAVSCIMKIIGDRYFMEQEILEIQKERVTTELNFLRSQVNPHFLFNVMNTIYFQIEKKNTAARLSVEKLSEMLRYQLYECTTDKIQIHKELQYIENYVAIQTLRMEKDSDVLLMVDHYMENFLIAPLLILPIVENAFKHVSNYKEAGRNKVHIAIKKDDDGTFMVESLNTYDKTLNGEKHLLQSGGLGMQNLKRRLELLYPDKYELNIDKEADAFKITLKLQYND